jgi:hypothetical protein
MIIFMERIEPPPPIVQVTDDESVKLKMEAIASEDRWVRNFIDCLTGVVRTSSTEISAVVIHAA